MRVLFDQGTPVRIRQQLREHTIVTARGQGWSTLLNGDLLRAAEQEGFEVLLTTDTSIPYQQNLMGRKLAIVIVNGNRWSLVKKAIPQIVAAVYTAKPGTCTVVDVPRN